MTSDRRCGIQPGLTREEILSLLDATRDCLQCRTEEDLKRIAGQVAAMFGATKVMCMHATMNEAGKIGQAAVVNVSFPPDWIAAYVENEYYHVDPFVAENFRSFALQYRTTTLRNHTCLPEFIRSVEEEGLSTGYSCGMRGDAPHAGSFFAFCGKKVREDKRTASILAYMTPALHHALTTLISLRNWESPDRLLTSREKEILAWIRHGKKNYEIAHLLDISENTVKFHIKNILRKSEARTRTHAVLTMAKEPEPDQEPWEPDNESERKTSLSE